MKDEMKATIEDSGLSSVCGLAMENQTEGKWANTRAYRLNPKP